MNCSCSVQILIYTTSNALSHTTAPCSSNRTGVIEIAPVIDVKCTRVLMFIFVIRTTTEGSVFIVILKTDSDNDVLIHQTNRDRCPLHQSDEVSIPLLFSSLRQTDDVTKIVLSSVRLLERPSSTSLFWMRPMVVGANNRVEILFEMDLSRITSNPIKSNQVEVPYHHPLNPGWMDGKLQTKQRKGGISLHVLLCCKNNK